MRIRVVSNRKEVGISAAEFARRLGISVARVIADCKAGRVVGAEFDRVTWRWWVYRCSGGRGCATWPLRRDLFPDRG